ncbi:MAG: L-2-amino-thiazoline-4-carboxylic acid hydrolase [Promethearchaeota archaeon]
MSEYYIENKGKLLEMFVVFMGYFKPYFAQKFPNENYEEFKKDTQKDLELLIPTIPYIGGFKNKFTEYLVSAPLVVAIYKNIKPMGIEDEEFGEFIFEAVGDYFTPKRKIIKLLGKFMTVGWLGKRLKKKNAAKPVQYEYEWKYDIIEDKNEEDLIYTMKYNQCGLQKYMEDLGYSHLTPYLCVTDYKLLSNLNIGFKRTQTIAMGGTYCDFQFRKNHPTPKTWDPEKFDDYREFMKLKKSINTNR